MSRTKSSSAARRHSILSYLLRHPASPIVTTITTTPSRSPTFNKETMADAMDFEEVPKPAIVHHPLMPSFLVELPSHPELFYDRVSFRKYIITVPLGPQEPPIEPPRNASMDALIKEDLLLPPNMMYTSKGAIAHSSTRSAFLDLSVKLGLPRVDGVLAQRLDAAWKGNAEDTLRLIWKSRSIQHWKG